MTDPIILPKDAVNFVYNAFERPNKRVSSMIDRMPTVHEENLDFAFIESFAEISGPSIMPSGVIVDISTHFLGGGRHWNNWEVADIGILINLWKSSKLVKTKVVLLQSKRLYPRQSEFTEDAGVSRNRGFMDLMDPSLSFRLGSRLFKFDETCRYKALQVGDKQWQAMMGYEEDNGIDLYYLLYHPSEIPHLSEIPANIPVDVDWGSPSVGCRVLTATAVRDSSVDHPRNYAPSFSDMKGLSISPGWRLPEFIIDEVLGCREGFLVSEDGGHTTLMRIFNRRSGPIASAIAFNIIVP